MTAASGAAIAGAKTPDNYFPGDSLVDNALRLGKTLDFDHSDASRREKVIDMPMHFFGLRQMPGDPRFDIAPRTPGVDVAPSREIEGSQPSYLHANPCFDLDR